MNFEDFNSVLNILLDINIPYEELLEIAQELALDIKDPHKNIQAANYPSAISQCILECYKRKYGFSSSTWVSSKHLDKVVLKDGSIPVKFTRTVTGNKTIDYEMYNADQFEIKEDENDDYQKISEDIFKNKNLRQIIVWILDNENIYNKRYIEEFKNDYSLNNESYIQQSDKKNNPKLSKSAKRILSIIEIKSNYAIKHNISNSFSILYNHLQEIKKDLANNSTQNILTAEFAKDLLIKEFNNNNPIYLEIINKLCDTEYSIKPEEKVIKVKPKSNNLKIKKAILTCIKEFSGQYGRSGIAKILKGSQGLKINLHNSDSLKSEYYGMFEQMTLNNITYEIDKLIEDNMIKVSKISFGRPVLSINKEQEAKIAEIIESCPDEDEEKIYDENLLKIADLIKKNKNIFITGHAGTGKSYILNQIKEIFPKVVITSTTGIAAVNVKGQTLHSWAGVGICNNTIAQTVEKILKKSSLKNQIQKCKILAIDEISMLDVRTFEYVNEVLKQVRSCSEPFGGIQVIFIGDFFQLPPVEKEENVEKKYCFESQLWNDLDLHTILLTKNYRQNEENLITALANMRVNSLTEKDIELLKTRENINTNSLENALHIFATNYEADNYNSQKFMSIQSPEYKLYAIDGIYKGEELIEQPTNAREEHILKRIDVVCRAEKSISLKVNARVMLLINLDFDKGLINGSCGNVLEIDDDYIMILFDNGVTSKIKRHDFEFYNNEVLIAIRRQFPLRLAYGITIHKSQGMSLDKLVVDCSKIFEKGQAYVALSRIKTLEGLYLRNFNPYKVMVDEKVVEFYKTLNVCNIY